MPFGMGGYVQSVMVVQGTVYVGGGYADWDSAANTYIVMAYDTSSEKWAKLPPYRARDFAMTVINNRLVLVGGYHGDKIKVVGVWRPDSKEWTHPYPDMPTPRSHCSAVTHKEWILVAGGASSRAPVELLNTDSKQWHTGPPTPLHWTHMKTAIVGSQCYFMGGSDYNRVIATDRVFSVSLPALLSQVDPKNSSECGLWKEIFGLQFTGSSPLSISGSLLAVGGRDKDLRAVSAIHLYQPDTGEWVKVGDLPTPRENCSCKMLTDKELLVAGGGDGQDWLKSVYVASRY